MQVVLLGRDQAARRDSNIGSATRCAHPVLTIDTPKCSILTSAVGIKCGSSSIDESFKHWLVHHWPYDGGLKNAAAELGLTIEDVLNRAIAFFEEHKNSFPAVAASGYEDIIIPPKRGKRVEAKEIYLD